MYMTYSSKAVVKSEIENVYGQAGFDLNQFDLNYDLNLDLIF